MILYLVLVLILLAAGLKFLQNQRVKYLQGHTARHESGTPPSKQQEKCVRQPFDAYLVVDFEGTCQENSDFNYPNEIIEFPIILLRWANKEQDGTASQLTVEAEFHTFVRPTWRPELSDFCTTLTGITQGQVDAAPTFLEALPLVHQFLVKHKLIDQDSSKAIQRYCWCTDGPWDFRDHLVKQCFMSKIAVPTWFCHNLVNSRKLVGSYVRSQHQLTRSLSIIQQLDALDLPRFEGKPHSGLDDSRNIAKIVIELARRGISLYPNERVDPSRRWPWMGKAGRVLVDRI